jgi:hypothetical protein
MSENQPFDFLKIAGHGSIIPKPYLLVLSLKKKEDRTMFFFQNGKFQDFKGFRMFFYKEILFFGIHQILS